MLFRSDRKSTRLNSSHLVISYAVFCLKKKKNNKQILFTHPHHHVADTCHAPAARRTGPPLRVPLPPLRCPGRLCCLFFFFFFLKWPAPPHIPPSPPPRPSPV